MSDTIPAPAPGPILAGQAGLALSRALTDVSHALSHLESTILAYDSVAAAVARQLDSEAPQTPGT